ncbi:hypothetical protein QFC22_005882 [Naganishia vaughanmartiniae]|uniref:Uncharacterized protein n=1 Tax=Naganishia vaughanmartiniae TaxID=1424756 RepID=A0ACC2WU55_9TREE|nr:hypothetical protein QFC22_005882 [Naganishia vaughanmartiniae]
MDKHIINTARSLVPESLLGLARTQPSLQLDEQYRVISLRYVPAQQVATSPVVGAVMSQPITGDTLLFGLAKEQYAITHPTYPVELVTIGDDVAVPRSQGTLVGRRGLAGTILAYKCAAALASEGKGVGECVDVARAVGALLGTIGVGLNHCHVPGTAAQENNLKGDQVEIGVGIHNESGILKRKLPPARQLIADMLAYITNTTDTERAFCPFKHDGGDRVVLLVNNLGGLSELEMGLHHGKGRNMTYSFRG